MHARSSDLGRNESLDVQPVARLRVFCLIHAMSESDKRVTRSA
jgi:hypothetical protein